MTKIYAVLLTLSLSGCKCMGETLIETATGGKVKIDGSKVTVTNERGEVATLTAEGKDGKGTIVVTNEKGEKATLTGDEKGVRIQSKDGAAEFGTGKVPEGFPLPVIDGAQVASGTRHETPKGVGFSLMASSDKDPTTIADFYQRALKEKGFTVERVQNPSMAGMVVLNGKQKKLAANCTVMRETADKPSSFILSWQPD